MPEINLLSSLQKVERNVQARLNLKDPEVVRISKQYGDMYFDGPRCYGYGGYRYDGRWIPVAKDMVDHFGLKAGDRVLDIGCAKGFLVKDFMKVCPGLEAYGIDISEYALMNCEPEIVGRLHLGNADHLPFPDESFNAVISLNTVHNLPRERVIIALREIQRVSGGKAYIQVDSYHMVEQKAIFENWVLTAEFHDYPEGWIKVFEEAGYTGDYNWTLV
ncbi:methyltransferase domain-containing protein [Coxiella endosymbiont of Ornithodoros amblus]|uniref:class I SAM-dependent methyltransferase n=1 Tax=Coxiella endosymbiont of Ornithodoros amblus TaxID=1656166 RepID=UPI00244DBA00|nr:methyltransferase domain-containing protein [Coxiella endosymbiont of Ornithodoros amblus]MBW5802272.1 methyltransferase domain-containing protein [Coxiella endosymbiont of Ornithodoros amblus]